MKTYITLCISFKEPQGGYIGTRGKGGQGANPGPKYRCGCARTAAKTRRARGAFCRALSHLSSIGCRSWFLILSPWFSRISSPKSMAIL